MIVAKDGNFYRNKCEFSSEIIVGENKLVFLSPCFLSIMFVLKSPGFSLLRSLLLRTTQLQHRGLRYKYDREQARWQRKQVYS